jgi:hypothetical protein
MYKKEEVPYFGAKVSTRNTWRLLTIIYEPSPNKVIQYVDVNATTAHALKSRLLARKNVGEIRIGQRYAEEIAWVMIFPYVLRRSDVSFLYKQSK